MKMVKSAFLLLFSLSFASFAEEPAPGAVTPGAVTAKASASNLVEFTDLAAAKSLAAKGPTVLFFSAEWCPFCQADLKEFKADGARLGGVTVVVVDYDTAKDLKARYKVAYQHTYVWIDSEAAAKAVWNGGGIDGILSRVKKA